MKLLASYNIFDGEEFLECSINQIRDHVDAVIGIVQSVSNWGNKYEGGVKEAERLKKLGLIDEILYYTPQGGHALFNELEKRRKGIAYGQKKGFTHILNLDCDELFHTNEFKDALRLNDYDQNDWTIIAIQTYFKSINLTIGIDSTFMPFICKLKKIHLGARYNKYKVDFTRAVNSEKYLFIGGIKMHHFSWVRRDINLKIQNSTARDNILRSRLLDDYKNAKEGLYIDHYGKKLKFVKTQFKCLHIS